MSRQKKEGKGIGMCRAIDDLILDGEKRREQRGEKRGQERLIVVLSENLKDNLII